LKSLYEIPEIKKAAVRIRIKSRELILRWEKDKSSAEDRKKRRIIKKIRMKGWVPSKYLQDTQRTKDAWMLT